MLDHTSYISTIYRHSRFRAVLFVAFTLSLVALLLTVFLPERRLSIYPAFSEHINFYDDQGMYQGSRNTAVTRQPAHWICSVEKVAQRTFCGASFLWSTPPLKTIDFSVFDYLYMDVEYIGDIDFITMIIRMAGDVPVSDVMDSSVLWGSFKVETKKFSNESIFFLNEIAIPEWWRKDNNLPDDEPLRLDKVISMNFELGNPRKIGSHEFIVRSMELRGRWLQLKSVLYVMAIFWLSFLVVCIIYIFSQRRAMLLNVQLDALEKAKHLALVANEEKTRFLSIASHDLRQPIHNLGYLIESLKFSKASVLTSQQHDSFKSSYDYLSRLLNSLMNLSKIDNHMIDTKSECFAVVAALEQLKEQYEKAANDKGLRLILESGENQLSTKEIDNEKLNANNTLYALCNTDCFMRIIGNFIDNAIKYTESGQVTLEASVCDGRVYVGVKDTGEGFDEEQATKIFNAFHQLDNANRTQQRGLGLGLHIVSRLCEEMAIKVSVDSIPGQGSCFTIELPLASDKDIASLHHSDETMIANVDVPISLENVSVLLVENELDIVESMERILSSWGMSVRCATNVDAVRVLLRTFEPQLMISDFMLNNGESGLDAIRLVKNALPKRSIPVVLMTGSVNPLLEAVTDLEIDHIIIKPVPPPKLRETLLAALIKEP